MAVRPLFVVGRQLHVVGGVRVRPAIPTACPENHSAKWALRIVDGLPAFFIRATHADMYSRVIAFGGVIPNTASMRRSASRRCRFTVAPSPGRR